MRPLEQDFPEESRGSIEVSPLDEVPITPRVRVEELTNSTVRLRPGHSPEVRVRELVMPEPDHAQARASILTKASAHIQQALIELNEAVAWFAIVDPKDQSDLVRRVEQLRDTIDYRRSL